MDFKTFWLDMPPDERNAFAAAVERSPGYLQLVAGGFRRASPALAIVIDDRTAGRVTRHELRPDIFGPPPPGQGRAAA